jgi:serine/threonine protein kinase/tetratricopeptide (TPR) repeat protein
VSGVCLDESTVLAFLDGKLPDAGRAEVETHLATCASCTEVATWTAAELAGGSRPPGREGRPFVGQLAAGARIGRYQILAPVGRGGMGEVYAAYHPDLDRRIALKVVHESGADSAERRARLLREARAIARLSHPNVVAVHDAGTVGDRVYIAMEFVDGVTLDEWLRAAPRTSREILDVFIAAGQGLAAAHAADIVHRDFKPQNVMIGKDGGVRVMDFGLASLVGEAADAGGDAAGAHDADPNESPQATVRVTRTDALLGTPAYMAPEQFENDPIDARADQYSFCVALHEAFHGTRPTPAELDGGPAPADIRSWLRQILRRGLSRDRNARFPSMADLLVALDHGRTHLRRRSFAVVAAIVTALVAFGAWRVSHARRFDCQPPRDRIAAAWPAGDPTNPRRLAIRQALLAGAGPDATGSWERIASTLDDYVGRWEAMYTEACEATRVRGEQSQEVLDLRMLCLNDNLDTVQSLTGVLATTSDEGIDHAVVATTDLPPVSRCGDVQYLRSTVPLPRDEKTLRAVRDLQRPVKDVRALYETGRFREAMDRATEILPSVEATGYRPLLSQLLAAKGILERVTGNAAKAESTLFDAFVAAEAGGDAVATAIAASHLVFVAGYDLGRHEDARRWLQLANAILTRLGPGHSELRAWLADGEGAILFQEGRYGEALPVAERALALRQQTLGSEHPQIAIAYSNLAYNLLELGDHKRALEAINKAIDIQRKQGEAWGAIVGCRGEILHALGRDTEARRDFDYSLSKVQTDREAAIALTGLAQVDLAAGEPTDARPLLERALGIREQAEPNSLLVAETRFALARALGGSGADHKRARSLATSAREACGREPCPRRLAGIDSWLSAHSPGARR